MNNTNTEDKGKKEVEAFLTRNKERLEKFRRIEEETAEEMEELSFRKAQTPELNELSEQVAITNAFLTENPDVPFVTLDDTDK